MTLTVLLLPRDNPQETKRLESVLTQALKNVPHRLIGDLSQVALPCKLLVAISLGEEGVNFALMKLLATLRKQKNIMKGSVAGLVMEAESDMYAKTVVTQLAFALNQSGCALVGSPLVEGTFASDGNVGNQQVLDQMVMPNDPLYPYLNAITLLGERIIGPGFRGKSPLTGRPSLPKLLVVHNSLSEESNLSDLWEEMTIRLAPFMAIDELSLRTQTVNACVQCNLHHCHHFLPSGQCFYGSVLRKEEFKKVAEADAMLLLCGNYHNGLHPLLSGFLHYVSDLFPQNMFLDKALYALVLSPYSGGDRVAEQILASLSLDSTFYLPPKFAMLETASQPMEALSLPDIEGRLDLFAHRILELLSLGHFC